MADAPPGVDLQALSSGQAFLRQFVEYAPVAIAMVDTDMRYVAVSARWRADFGLRESVIGLSHYDVFPEVPGHWREIHRRCLAGAVERKDEEVFVRTDGSRQWIRWEVQPWRADGEHIGGLIIFVEEITARKEAEIALRENEERLRLAMEASAAGTWTLDVRTNQVVLDDRSRRMFGFAPRDFVDGDEIMACVHEEDRTELFERLEALHQALDDNEWDAQYRVRHPNGPTLWIHSLGRAERDESGRIVRMSGININITARKHSQAVLRATLDQERQSAETMRLILGTALQGIVGVVDGVIVTTNLALGRMFGYDAGELVGRPIEDLLPDTLRSRHVEHRRTFARLPRARPMGTGLDLVGRRRDGSTFPVEVSLSYVSTASGDRVIAFVTDITDRKRADAALRAHAGELERLNEQLRRLASDLTLTEQRAREQLARTLHDGLQQLLFSAMLRVDRAAKHGGAAELLEAAHADLQNAIAAARSLSVELFPPALRQGGLPSALVWLADWMKQKYNLSVRTSVDSDANPTQEDVRLLVFESVRELLFNAVKHARVDGVALALSRDADGGVRVVVSDEGVGFEPAAMLEASAMTGGLGLFGIRERLLLFGGRLEVASAPGRGARFALTVPGARPADPAVQGTPSVPHPPRRDVSAARSAARLRVLLVDDHVVVRAGLREMLGEHPSLEVVGEAADGFQAVTQARLLRPDAIVMDVMMDGMGGVEATRQIRAELPAVQIFALSTDERVDGVHAIETAGANGYFTKGEGVQLLVDRLLTISASKGV